MRNIILKKMKLRMRKWKIRINWLFIHLVGLAVDVAGVSYQLRDICNTKRYITAAGFAY